MPRRPLPGGRIGTLPDVSDHQIHMSTGLPTTVLPAPDAEDARRLQVQGTPTFFVNGRRIMGAQPLSAFREVIDQALAAAPKSP